MNLTRITAAAGAVAAAGMLLAPAVAHADGTKDPKYQHPPTTSQPKSDDDGAAPINNDRAPVKKCGQESTSGEFSGEPSHHPYELEPGTKSITVDYDTFDVPDKINVYAKGKLVGTTGWRGSESENTNRHPLKGGGDDELTVAVPANTASVDVVVITDLQGTAWKFTVGCIKA